MIKKKKYALLIEPNYPTKVLSFGLQKIATYLLNKNYEVKFIKGLPTPTGFFDRVPDEIYITSLFTYYGREVIKTIKLCQRLFPKAEIKVGGIFASLMPEYIKEETGIKPHVGLWKEIDNCNPNFSLFPETDKITVFTSRGCFRKCKFCAVKTLEPKSYVIKEWKEHILSGNKEKNLLLIQDNNFVATPWKHQKEVIEFIKKIKIKVDINGGFDCRIFKEKHAKLYSGVDFLTIRFAFDDMNSDGYIQRAIEISKKYISSGIRVYVLYNFNDTPQEFYYRIKELNRLGVKPYPMRYADITSNIKALKKRSIGKYWDRDFLNKMQSFLVKMSRGSMFLQYKLETFEKKFGRNEKEFIDIINNHKIRKEKSYGMNEFDFDI